MVHPHDSINQRRVGTKDSKARRTAFGADAYGDERDQRDERDVRDHDSHADKRDQPRDRHSRKDSRAGDTRNKDFRAGDIRNTDLRADARDQRADQRNHGH